MAPAGKFAERVRVGRQLKAERDGQPYTQLDLANALAKSRNAIDAWENGRAHPPPHTRAAIAGALGVTVDWLEGRTDNPQGSGVNYVSAQPIARAMGMVREGSEVRFASPTSAQRARHWLEGFLLSLAEEGATESFIESARRLLLNPANYVDFVGAAAGHKDEMEDDAKLRHMKALAEGVRAALKDRSKKGRAGR